MSYGFVVWLPMRRCALGNLGDASAINPSPCVTETTDDPGELGEVAEETNV